MSRHSRTRLATSRTGLPLLRSGKATLSNTLIESNSAPSWNAIPNSLRTSLRALSEMDHTSTPSTNTFPESGRINPMRCFNSTLFPVPEGPTITSDSPSATEKVTPSRTRFVSNVF